MYRQSIDKQSINKQSVCKHSGYRRALIVTAATVCMGVGSAVADMSLPDPTLPLEYKGASSADYRPELNSILVGNNRKLAIISGQVFTEGQELNGVKVLKIEASKVVVRVNGKQQTLVMHKSLRLMSEKD